MSLAHINACYFDAADYTVPHNSWRKIYGDMMTTINVIAASLVDSAEYDIISSYRIMQYIIPQLYHERNLLVKFIFSVFK